MVALVYTRIHGTQVVLGYESGSEYDSLGCVTLVKPWLLNRPSEETIVAWKVVVNSRSIYMEN